MKLSEYLKKWRCERPDEWIMDHFIRDAVELEKSRNWISVKDRLPEEGKEVFIYYKYKAVDVYPKSYGDVIGYGYLLGFRIHDKFKFYNSSEKNMDDVLFWMIPEPPEGI